MSRLQMMISAVVLVPLYDFLNVFTAEIYEF